jgi:hypothetical protein
MRLAGSLVKARADNLFAMRNHATNAGIGLRGEKAALGQTQGVRHVDVVDGVEGGGHGRAVSPCDDVSLCEMMLFASSPLRGED